MFRLLHFCLFLVAAARAPTDRPNFVMLFVDDMGYGDTGFNGNASVHTPNIDKLAFDGKILTTWYSGCPICTGSRAALMTGRQFPRTGLPGGIGPVHMSGLRASETTIAEQLKKANYTTAAVGKWHLGQRTEYLPGSKGFDQYLGVPYSNDMGNTLQSVCRNSKAQSAGRDKESDARDNTNQSSWNWKPYYDAGYIKMEDVKAAQRDPAALWLPLIQQSRGGEPDVLEQPLDLTTLSEKYSDFAVRFIQEHKDEPFFLYVPFSHVHSVYGNWQHGPQYAGCRFRGKHGSPFVDALAETDWMVGNIYEALQAAGILENTMILFTGDNGPQLQHGPAAGSAGILTGSSSGYWNTGKGSTWEGGIRSAAFAYWKGQIEPHSRSSEIVSSLDVFPTLSKLAGVDLDASRVYDGKDMSQVLLQPQGRSKHDFLFFYGGCNEGRRVPSAVRYGQYKAHFCTAPGLGGCDEPSCRRMDYTVPLLFDVVKDPGESEPLNPGGVWPDDPDRADVLKRIGAAFETERAAFSFGEPAETTQEPAREIGICCSRRSYCNCNKLDYGWPWQRKKKAAAGGVLAIGTGHFHDRYHHHGDVPKMI